MLKPSFRSLFAVALCTLGFAQTSQAYFVAVPKSQGPVDYAQPTHVLLSGRGTNIGMQPQMSALSKAVIYQRNFKTQQVVLISVLENDANEALLTKAGWSFIVKNDEKLDTTTSVNEIKKFTKIKSLELFGHNSPSLGTQTDGLGFRFDARLPIVAALASNFDTNAYATIHGCNSGWLIAQNLSNVWKIAVAGSFTGTRFERLHSDGHLYVNVTDKAPSTKWASRNDDLGGLDCEMGGCMRMRPAYSPYNGHWGDLEGAMLNHYKFFCQLETKECEKRMALSMYGYLSEKTLTPKSTKNEFRQTAKEYLCPVYKDLKIFKDCQSQLEKIEAGRGNKQISYEVRGEQLSCSLKSCTGKMTCDDLKPGCKIESRVSKGSTTLADEYMHLLNGFEQLQSAGVL